MRSLLRISEQLVELIHEDLSRPHSFAAERIGFLVCRFASSPGSTLMLAHSFHSVSDEDYEDAPMMGAMISGNAFRKLLQYSYANDVGVFHLHRHEHRGTPQFSQTDKAESKKFVPDFFKVRPNRNHGAIVFSFDSIYGWLWDVQTRNPRVISRIDIVGRRRQRFDYLVPI